MGTMMTFYEVIIFDVLVDVHCTVVPVNYERKAAKVQCAKGMERTPRMIKDEKALGFEAPQGGREITGCRKRRRP